MRGIPNICKRRAHWRRRCHALWELSRWRNSLENQSQRAAARQQETSCVCLVRRGQGWELPSKSERPVLDGNGNWEQLGKHLGRALGMSRVGGCVLRVCNLRCVWGSNLCYGLLWRFLQAGKWMWKHYLECVLQHRREFTWSQYIKPTAELDPQDLQREGSWQGGCCNYVQNYQWSKRIKNISNKTLWEFFFSFKVFYRVPVLIERHREW